MAEVLRSTANGRSPGRRSGSARAWRAACALLLCVLLQGCATTAMWRSLGRPDDAPVQWDNERLAYAACEITAIGGGAALLVQISSGADTTVAYECAPAEGYGRRFAELLERTDSKELRIDEHTIKIPPREVMEQGIDQTLRFLRNVHSARQSNALDLSSMGNPNFPLISTKYRAGFFNISIILFFAGCWFLFLCECCSMAVISWFPS